MDDESLQIEANLMQRDRAEYRKKPSLTFFHRIESSHACPND